MNYTDELEIAFLWADPQVKSGWSPSPRGCTKTFGPDIILRFLNKNKYNYIVRSHQVKQEGYEWDITHKLLTVFSAPRYSGLDNVGAFADLWFDTENVNGNGEQVKVPHFTIQQFCDYDERDKNIYL